MAHLVTESHREVKDRFLSGQIIPIRTFYNLLYTPDLMRLRVGLERDFDAACGGDKTRQPKPWLLDRLHLINQLLEERIPT